MKNLLFILVALCFSAQINAQIVIKNVNIIDVKSGKILPSSSVVIVGEQLKEVGPSSKVKYRLTPRSLMAPVNFLCPA